MAVSYFGITLSDDNQEVIIPLTLVVEKMVSRKENLEDERVRVDANFYDGDEIFKSVLIHISTQEEVTAENFVKFATSPAPFVYHIFAHPIKYRIGPVANATIAGGHVLQFDGEGRAVSCIYAIDDEKVDDVGWSMIYGSTDLKSPEQRDSVQKTIVRVARTHISVHAFHNNEETEYRIPLNSTISPIDWVRLSRLRLNQPTTINVNELLTRVIDDRGGEGEFDLSLNAIYDFIYFEDRNGNPIITFETNAATTAIIAMNRYISYFGIPEHYDQLTQSLSNVGKSVLFTDRLEFDRRIICACIDVKKSTELDVIDAKRIRPTVKGEL